MPHPVKKDDIGKNHRLTRRKNFLKTPPAASRRRWFISKMKTTITHTLAAQNLVEPKRIGYPLEDEVKGSTPFRPPQWGR